MACSLASSLSAPLSPCQRAGVRPSSVQQSLWLAQRGSQRFRRRELACQGFLSGLFGSGPAVADEAAAPAEDYSSENLDEVLLTEVEAAGGRRYIVYRNGAVVDAAALEQLCDKVGWPRRPLNKVQAALANSFLVSALFLEAQPPASSTEDASSSDSGSSNSNGGGGAAAPPGSRLIGLARCTSDGAFNATIWDVLVDPEFQGQGLGKALVEGMTRTLLRREITNITLFADANVVNFYTGLGYAADPEGIKGMFWHPRF
ncbi:hypothetical protein ABPG75_009637 [Micractinium tetrahymenae]